ncbi:MAG TPA: two-component regulator propeller domain-containing protein, partial [Candidatus Deferrimicrobium sp.]|nr:two-component regulator propeller domain-containing protein [Candidatus Deferrimicrobium sp.]
MMKRPAVIFMFFLIFIPVFSPYGIPQTNNILFQHISTKQGLSQVTVNSIFQDSKGFMWFGTQDGLNKYDGYTFTVYKNDPQNPDTLSQNYITAIIEDKKGFLWIGTRLSGFSRFNTAAGTYKHFVHYPRNPNSLSNNSVNDICIDQEGLLWIATDDGLNRFNPKNGTFIRYYHEAKVPGSLGSDIVRCVYEDYEGTIWVGTHEGLDRFDPKTGRFTHYLNIPNDPTSLSDNEVTAIYRFGPGPLWVGTHQGGLNRLNPGTRTFKRFMFTDGKPGGLSHNWISKILGTGAGVLWIGTHGGGVNQFDPRTETFINYRGDPDNPRALNDNDIRSIYEDRTGILWFGTFNGGVNKFDPRTSTFVYYTHNPHNSKSLGAKSITAICEDHTGVLWVGTANGLNQCDTQRERFKIYKNDPAAPRSLSNNDVWALNEDKDGTLWVGTRNGLNRFDRKTETFYRYFHDPQDPTTLSDNDILVIYKTDPSCLWIGTAKAGLNQFDRNKEVFKHYKHDPQDPNTLSSNFVLAIYQDHWENLWVGTLEGLNKLNLKTGKIQRYFMERGKPGSLSYNTIVSIYEDSKGRLWIGTAGGGLNLYVAQQDAFRHYQRELGLLNSVINGILEDNKGYLWLSTNQGIFRFDPGAETFSQFDIFDGLQGNEFNAGAYFKSPGGRFYFGGVSGLTAFFPHEVTRNPHAPPIEITSFQKLNKQMFSGKPLSGVTELKLTYKDYVISFEFAALDFAAPEKNQYAYKMEGFDKQWMTTDSKKRFATYTNLDPGEYVFRVKGSNNHGVWNEKDAEVTITIMPPFWKTSWFRIFTVMIIVGLILLSYMIWVRKIQGQKKKLEELVYIRTRDLQLKKEELEKINNIVKVINAEVTLADFLESLLRETFGFEAGEQASALVFDEETKMYNCEASVGQGTERSEDLGWSPEELEIKYIQQAKEISNDVFLSERIGMNGKKCAALAIQVRIKEKLAGYLIFDNLRPRVVLDDKNIELLRNLKDHIISAFTRDKLLMELKNANDRVEKERLAAEKANRFKGDFLARMSHEIRTPMNSIIGFIEMLLDTDLNEEQRDYMRTINQSGESLLLLINDILDFSRVESGQLTLESIDFDPEVMAFDVCELMRPRIGSKPVDIFCRIEDKVPSNVKGDPARYRQVLINLLGNAVKFTHKGEIELRITVDSETRSHVTLHATIKDTGIGIDKEIQENIFEVFQQGLRSISRKYGGSGLGLPICKQISKLLGGDVWVESEPDIGSTFHFTAILKKSGKKPADLIVPETLAGKKVLVVDDNKNNLDILAHMLTAAGMEVVTLARGADVIPM